jgi:hypothetical protein
MTQCTCDRCGMDLRGMDLRGKDRRYCLLIENRLLDNVSDAEKADTTVYRETTLDLCRDCSDLVMTVAYKMIKAGVAKKA